MSSPVDIEAFYDLKDLTEVAVSPDGDRVAFVVQECDAVDDERRAAVYVVPTDGNAEPYRLTRASTATNPRWSPDGDSLAFLARREDDLSLKTARHEPEDDEGDDDEDPNQQVWAFDLERGGDARQLTDSEEGVREFDWSPDGNRLVVSARDPTAEEREYLEQRRDDGPVEVTRLQHKQDGHGWLDDVTTYLFVFDVSGDAATTESAQRIDEAYGAGKATVSGGLQPRWGPADRIAFRRTDTDHPDDSLETDLFTIAPNGDDLRKLTNGGLRTGTARWHPVGEKMAFVAGNPENWYEPSEVYVVDEQTQEYWSVSSSLDRTVARNGTLEWQDEKTIICPFADEGLTRLVALDAEADNPQRIFNAQGRDRNIEAFDLAGNTVAVGLGTASEGKDVYTFDAATLEPSRESVRRLTELNADVLREAPAPYVRRVSFENSDGDDVEAIVYLPADFEFEDPDPVPTIAAIHGGPMSYDAPTYEFKHTVWTSRGYGIVRVNYRGSTSYGREFSEQLKGSRGDLESDDVVSGVRHLVDKGWADPDRLFVTGFSYGGITSAHIVTRYDDFAAAAPEHGIYDFYSNFGTDDNHIWHEWEFGLPWENQEKYRDLSSLTDADQIETPLLITAGEEDWRCPPTQAEQLYVSVRKRGVDAKLVVYPGEHHNIGDPKRATHRLRELTDWFEKHDPEA